MNFYYERTEEHIALGLFAGLLASCEKHAETAVNALLKKMEW